MFFEVSFLHQKNLKIEVAGFRVSVVCLPPPKSTHKQLTVTYRFNWVWGSGGHGIVFISCLRIVKGL